MSGGAADNVAVQRLWRVRRADGSALYASAGHGGFMVASVRPESVATAMPKGLALALAALYAEITGDRGVRVEEA